MVHKRLEGSHSSLLSPASLYLGLLFQKPRWFSLIGNMTFHILQQSSKVHKVGSGDPTCNPLALSLLWSAVWCSGALPSLPWSPLPCWLITLLLCLPVHIQLPLPFSYRLVFIISFRGPWNGSGSREISFASNKWDSKVHTHTQSNTSMLLEVFQVSPRFLRSGWRRPLHWNSILLGYLGEAIFSEYEVHLVNSNMPYTNFRQIMLNWKGLTDGFNSWKCSTMECTKALQGGEALALPSEPYF